MTSERWPGSFYQCRQTLSSPRPTQPGVLAVSQSTQCATLGLARGPLRSPFEPPSTSPCRAVALLRIAPPSHTPA